jgi:hypothetical protein
LGTGDLPNKIFISNTTAMKKHRNPGKGQNKVFSGKPEIRDNLDSRKNEEFRNTGAIKKAEVQQKEKQKETRKNK